MLLLLDWPVATLLAFNWDWLVSDDLTPVLSVRCWLSTEPPSTWSLSCFIWWKSQRGRAETPKISWSLGSEVTQHYFCCILLVEATYKVRADEVGSTNATGCKEYMAIIKVTSTPSVGLELTTLRSRVTHVPPTEPARCRWPFLIYHRYLGINPAKGVCKTSEWKTVELY